MRMLNAHGIGATVNYRSVTELSLYRQDESVVRGSCPVSREWGEGTLSLPLFPTLQDVEQDYILNVLRYEILPTLQSSETEERGVAAL